MGAGYGISTNMIGLSHFVVVTPAIFSGGWLAARLGIGFWMLLFGLLGWALVKSAARAR